MSAICHGMPAGSATNKYVTADFARTLERELIESNKRYERLRESVNGSAPRDLERLEQLERYIPVCEKTQRENVQLREALEVEKRYWQNYTPCMIANAQRHLDLIEQALKGNE